MPGTTAVNTLRRLALLAPRTVVAAAGVLFLCQPAFAEDYPLPVDPSQWPGSYHEHHHHGDWDRDRDTITVRCGLGRHDSDNLRDAIRHVRANGKILIRPPGDGTTCVETLDITKPLTIATYGGGHDAVIQAPAGANCVNANVPLGDSVIFEGIKFIARGQNRPCVHVVAGQVIVRHSDIDSRNTDWAFDVEDSGELTIEDSKIETDGAGVHALRAEVHIRNLEIDMSPARLSPALVLDRTDGEVQGGEIIGGRWGVVASAGPHGLTLSDFKVRNANTAVELLPGAQGHVRVEKLSLSDNRTGLVVGPYVDADINDNVISGSEDNGMVLYAANARVEDNKITGGKIGIRIARVPRDETDHPRADLTATTYPQTDGPPPRDDEHRASDERPVDFWGNLDPNRFQPADDRPERGTPSITGNFIADIRDVDIYGDDGAHARILDNQLIARPHCLCIVSHTNSLAAKGNDCRNASHGRWGD